MVFLVDFSLKICHFSKNNSHTDIDILNYSYILQISKNSADIMSTITFNNTNENRAAPNIRLLLSILPVRQVTTNIPFSRMS